MSVPVERHRVGYLFEGPILLPRPAAVGADELLNILVVFRPVLKVGADYPRLFDLFACAVLQIPDPHPVDVVDVHRAALGVRVCGCLREAGPVSLGFCGLRFRSAGVLVVDALFSVVLQVVLNDLCRDVVQPHAHMHAAMVQVVGAFRV